MLKFILAKSLLILGIFLGSSTQVHAQKDKFLRSNQQFVEAFREVVAKPSLSTVRILCDGKDTALGMVVGAEGWILTKANDLQGKISCKLKDGREFEARLVGLHKEHDLAMLKIDAQKLVPVEFTSSKGLDAGSWVACAGLKEEPVAIGVVSVGTRTIVNKGFTFTIDNTKAGFLGVNLAKAEGGVLITIIEPRSAADRHGLKVNDVVIALGGRNILEVETFIQEMGKNKPGDVVTLKIRRDEEVFDVIATLGKRPSNMSRGDSQNKMGSELSSRRSGYSTILQHDSVVKPTDCGGPIVDLEGRVIGINICRAGRTESWAVPSEVVQTVLADLKSGKLAPPAVQLSQTKAQDNKRIVPLREKAKDIDDLLGLMKQRLELTFDVARFKFINKQTITDDKREDRLLTKLLDAAQEEGLERNLVRKFFSAQFAASRQLQEELHANWRKEEKSLPAGDIPDLKKNLRPKLDQISLDIVEALAKVQPYLSEKEVQNLLRLHAAAVLQGGAISKVVRDKALEAWLP